MKEGGSGTERSWCQRDVLSQPRSSSHRRPDRSRRCCWPFLLLPARHSRPPSSPSPSLHLSRPPRVGRRTLAEGALRKVKKMWRHVRLKWKLVLWVLRLPFFSLRAFKGNTLPDGSLVGAEAEVPPVQFVVPTSVAARTLQQNSTLRFPEGINSW